MSADLERNYNLPGHSFIFIYHKPSQRYLQVDPIEGSVNLLAERRENSCKCGIVNLWFYLTISLLASEALHSIPCFVASNQLIILIIL